MARKASRTSYSATGSISPQALSPKDSGQGLAKERGVCHRFRALGFPASAAACLLAIHVAMAEQSLLQENPTVDEVVHLPAGITYWQQGTFRLYPHNPPLVKLVAAIPVLGAGPVTAPVYQMPSWTSPDPSPATFAQTFAFHNRERYFELFRLARMVMPLFSVIGGLVVYLWSRELYGWGGGLLSLALWVFCPNILAHGRLITADVGSTAIGAAATYAFWRSLKQPSKGRILLAGVLLGLAQLTKFSMILLYAIWPFLWLTRQWLTKAPGARWRGLLCAVLRGAVVVVLSVLTINMGYGFEGTGIPLGRFEFGSRALTTPLAEGIRRPPPTRNELYARAWTFRENRFRRNVMAALPVPLPRHYVLGFDEQKMETEGLLLREVKAFDAYARGDLSRARDELASGDRRVVGYRVYLNGELRDSGWWYYYLAALLYKVPEGTWLLVGLASALLLAQRRPRESWADELTLAAVPLVVLISMSALTDINLGLRYVLPIAPYVFIAVGKTVPWIERLSGPRQLTGRAFIALALGLTIAATARIHPHYLAYFNWLSGGPDRDPPRLIDSNLDWGQDLLGLREWCRRKLPNQPIGLAYFGQINPSIFTLRGDRFDWFLPPARPGSIRPVGDITNPRLIGPARSLTPGYYAISATLVYGLPWRLYDSALVFPDAWAPTWNAFQPDAFGYFRRFRPLVRIGHSILVYELTAADVALVAPLFEDPAG